MRRYGFWFNGEHRHDPTTWDINCGGCEDFANAVAGRIPGAVAVDAYDPELHPFRENCDICGSPAFVVSHQEHHHGVPGNIDYISDADHKAFIGWDSDRCIIKFQGRFYDAECHEGVDCVRDLPIYKNQGKSRALF